METAAAHSQRISAGWSVMRGEQVTEMRGKLRALLLKAD
jgi:hypothetical protein